jgi:hypothetical protein
MGVDLFGHGGASLNWHAWRWCLEVAEAFGWQPAGTAPPAWNEGGPIPPASRDREWSGTYFSNDFASVTDSDARALASALFRAIDALRTNQPLTPEQAAAIDREDADPRVLDYLARYVWKGGFDIG